LGKTALTAEMAQQVVGSDRTWLNARPSPDGVVLIDFYRHM
jgi:hypothetical protein